ncbi:DMT family transporter [Flavisphingomonas formosensis]|uniref:DMT family transporter n=1 Tax=Flavisphingomonas formosensis TaxID=861534 RepID=UPI001E2C59B3|nr:DMT family transporter [Sphingomonas formosensis]
MMQSTRTLPPPLVFAIAVLGIAIFSCMDAVMKHLVLAIGAYVALLWRSIAGVAVSGLLYAIQRPGVPSRAALILHAVRGVVSAGMAVTFFWGLARVPMAQAVALTFIAPLLSLFLSAALLGERLARTAIVASSIALAGVVVILLGQWQAELGPEALRGALAILFAALCYAFNIVLMRRQAQEAGPIEVAFSQSLVVAAVLALGAPWFAVAPDVRHAPLILLAAVLAVVSLLLLAWAYARGEANYLSPSEYTSFVWAALFGWLLFGEHVARLTLLGAAMIIAGCVIAARQRPPAIIDAEAAY